MVVLVAGAHGRLGSRVLALLLHRGHRVRALVRTEGQAAALREIGAEAVVADLRGDVEWTADGCEAAVFAAGARHRDELGAIDAGGAAKLAEAADRYEHCALRALQRGRSAASRSGATAACASSSRRSTTPSTGSPTELGWSILRFGRLTEDPAPAIATALHPGPLTVSRDDAALAVAETLVRDHLAARSST